MAVTVASGEAEDTSQRTIQPWAYALILAASGVALGVSGAPAPLYGIYQKQWHFSPLTTNCC
jgi:hypothetical protein